MARGGTSSGMTLIRLVKVQHGSCHPPRCLVLRWCLPGSLTVLGRTPGAGVGRCATIAADAPS